MTTMNNLLQEALQAATPHNRNQAGFDLARKLRDRSISEAEAERIMLEYAGSVRHNGDEPYTDREALESLRSAYSRPIRGGGGYNSSNGEGCQPANLTPKQIQNKVGTYDGTQNANMPTANPGLTLVKLATVKKLPEDYLKTLGVSDFKLQGSPVVRIAYFNQEGDESAVRFRLSMSGDQRFKWRKGDQTSPYGLNKLSDFRARGWVLVVEGESDCWTCWYHGIPAIGAPGKTNWKAAWGEYLQGFDVYVWAEPGAGDFVLRVLKTCPQVKFITAPEGIKDPSEAHLKGIDLPSWLEELKAKSEAGAELRRRMNDEDLATTYQEALPILTAEDPLVLVESAIKSSGFGGDTAPAVITYLAATSRVLEMRLGSMPVHELIKGQASSGKNYLLNRVMALLPEESAHTIDAGSPRVMIYDDSDLQHKVLIFSEADSLPAGEDNPAASAVRNLLQDHHLHYAVTVKDPSTGDFTIREVDKPGPTVMITTSTRSLGNQLMTRVFTLELSDDQAQIAFRLQAQGRLETEDVQPPDKSLVAFQKYLQLCAPIKVRVPFAFELASAMAKMPAAPRIQRDFARLLSLIKSCALLRQHHRQKDEEGAIIADLSDYSTVRTLVNTMYIDSASGANDRVRVLVNKVIELDSCRLDGQQITNTQLAQELQTNTKQVVRWATTAIKLRWLVNNEPRKYHPADYGPGEPMPDNTGLPPVEGLAVGTLAFDVPTQMPTQNEAKNANVGRLAPFTVGFIGHTPPAKPCFACGSTDYWLSGQDWICNTCHPEPKEGKK